MPNAAFAMIARESVRFTISSSGANAQKTTEWPFVLEVMVDFMHFRPKFCRFPFQVELLLVPAERSFRWSV